MTATTGAQEATVYHHSIALALTEARVADLQSAPAHRGWAMASRRRDRRRLRALAAGLGAIADLTRAHPRPASRRR